MPFLGKVGEQAGQTGALVIAVLGSAALLFLWDLIQAPALIDDEKSLTIKEQQEALAVTIERAKPRIVIERLAPRPNDIVLCLEVRNPSPTEALSDCFARIEHRSLLQDFPPCSM